ncbi:rCG50902 [Rattus norvegicus]|uniref:RCG50902 n=1 Tax=Rattus norvegicus TaxID=10116 RepID=A6KJ63_RAT|nr:rCG50902 [Rattus norvegicus]
MEARNLSVMLFWEKEHQVLRNVCIQELH